MHSLKKFKIARRLGVAIFDKCQTGKFSLQKKNIGKRTGGKKPSDYSLQLTEKQKVRYFYNIAEKQFRGYVNAATKTHTPARTLFETLENRLDNVAYRAGLAVSRQG